MAGATGRLGEEGIAQHSRKWYCTTVASILMIHVALELGFEHLALLICREIDMNELIIIGSDCHHSCF